MEHVQFLVSRQDSHADNVLVGNTQCVSARVLVYVCDRCVCTRILRRRYQEGEWAFEVTEEVGHVIVQPCVLVRARVYVHA